MCLLYYLFVLLICLHICFFTFGVCIWWMSFSVCILERVVLVFPGFVVLLTLMLVDVCIFAVCV